MSLQMTDAQQCVLTVSAVDAKGNPTTVTPGSLTWLVDNPNLLSVTSNPDGTATVSAVGPIGQGNVTVNATIAGAAVSGTITVNIISGAPTQLSISAGAPSDQGTPTPPAPQVPTP